MKLRSQQQILDAIDGDLAWRTKELNNLCAALVDARESFRPNIARSAFLLVYAHWEGGVKQCASYFLEYVSRQKHKYNELRSNFVAVACSAAIQQAAASGRLHVYAQVVDFLLFNQDDRYQKPSTFEIQTDSNLSSKVMDNICFNIGVSLGDDFELSRNFIDRNLLKVRNSIAHGGHDPIESAVLLETRDRVLKLLGMLKNEIQNAVVQKSYLR